MCGGKPNSTAHWARPRHFSKPSTMCKPQGNAPREGDPHGEFRGQNILFERESLAIIVAPSEWTENQARVILMECRDKLFEIRARRPRPHRDEKIITAWNGLMISAFARAGAILDDGKYLQAAIGAAEFIQTELFDAENGTLQRHYKDGASPIGGFADDYAFLIRGLLDLWEASGQTRWLQWAQVLASDPNAPVLGRSQRWLFQRPLRPPRFGARQGILRWRRTFRARDFRAKRCAVGATFGRQPCSTARRNVVALVQRTLAFDSIGDARIVVRRAAIPQSATTHRFSWRTRQRRFSGIGTHGLSEIFAVCFNHQIARKQS